MLLDNDIIAYTYYIAGKRLGNRPDVDHRDIAQEVLYRALKTPQEQAIYWKRLIKFLCLNVWREKYTNKTRCKKDITRESKEIKEYGRYYYENEYIYYDMDDDGL